MARDACCVYISKDYIVLPLVDNTLHSKDMQWSFWVMLFITRDIVVECSLFTPIHFSIHKIKYVLIYLLMYTSFLFFITSFLCSLNMASPSSHLISQLMSISTSKHDEFCYSARQMQWQWQWWCHIQYPKRIDVYIFELDRTDKEQMLGSPWCCLVFEFICYQLHNWVTL